MGYSRKRGCFYPVEKISGLVFVLVQAWRRTVELLAEVMQRAYCVFVFQV